MKLPFNEMEKKSSYETYVTISPQVKLVDNPLEHENHGVMYNCENSWCLRYLCDCDSNVHYEPDTDSCPTINKQLKHQHEKSCAECDRILLKDVSNMFSKALRESENNIMESLKE